MLTAHRHATPTMSNTRDLYYQPAIQDSMIESFRRRWQDAQPIVTAAERRYTEIYRWAREVDEYVVNQLNVAAQQGEAVYKKVVEETNRERNRARTAVKEAHDAVVYSRLNLRSARNAYNRVRRSYGQDPVQ